MTGWASSISRQLMKPYRTVCRRDILRSIARPRSVRIDSLIFAPATLCIFLLEGEVGTLVFVRCCELLFDVEFNPMARSIHHTLDKPCNNRTPGLLTNHLGYHNHFVP